MLIDLKMGKITHQDVGQIDMYVRMYDELKCKEGDNPTLGILLCAETDVLGVDWDNESTDETIFALHRTGM